MCHQVRKSDGFVTQTATTRNIERNRRTNGNDEILKRRRLARSDVKITISARSTLCKAGFRNGDGRKHGKRKFKGICG